MRFLNMSHVRTANVVKRRQPQQTAIWWQRALATLAAVFCVFAVAALPMCAEADDASSPSPSTSSSSSSSSSSDASSGATLSADITDPNNLLGENATSVTDMITKTKNEYGVSVRLLYLDSFGTKTKPTTWASTLLQSTSPSPNTVLLAVASADGNLVVAVSNNSDKWLKDQKSVDALSEAALGPLTAKKGAPDWSGSAIAMMNEIGKLKETSTSGDTKDFSIGLFVGVALLLVALVVVIIVLARNAKGAHSKGGKQDRSRKAMRRRDAKRSKQSKRGKRSEQRTPSNRHGDASKHVHPSYRHTGSMIDGEPQEDPKASESEAPVENRTENRAERRPDLGDAGTEAHTSATSESDSSAVDEYLKRFSQQVAEHSQETRRQKRNARKHEQTN